MSKMEKQTKTVCPKSFFQENNFSKLKYYVPTNSAVFFLFIVVFFQFSGINSLAQETEISSSLNKQPLYNLQLLHSDDTLDLFANSSALTILPDQHLMNSPDVVKNKLIEIAGARNEKEQFLLIINPKKDLENVSLKFSALKGPAVLDSKACSYQTAVNVFIPHASSMYAVSALQKGWIPDPLVKGIAFSAPKNKNTSLLLTIDIPESLTPGNYSGSIDVICENEVYTKLPLKLTVWDICLPKKRRFQTRVHEKGGAVKISMFNNKALSEEMVNYGVTALKYGAYGLGIKPEKKNNKVSLELKTEEYYKQCRFILDECGFQYITLLPKFLIERGRGPIKNYLGNDVEVGSSEFWPLFKEYMTKMRNFYKEHGWENKVIFQICDEVEKEYNPLIIKIAQEAKKHFPEVKTFITFTKPVSEDVAKAIDIACLNWSMLAFNNDDINWYRYKKEYNLELWSYQNGIFHINNSQNPGMLRLYPPVNIKYGSQGILWYALGYTHGNEDYWNKVPFQYKHKPQKKKKKQQHEYQFGGGQLLYPPRENEPYIHSSLRWESYCQGLEDAELMLVLKDKIEQALKIAGLPDSKEFSADYLIQGWGSLLTDKFRCEYYRPDASYIQRFRALVAYEILNILKPPVAIVSFKENQLWKPESSSVTLLIKSKDAHKIKVNGIFCSENKQGIFTCSYKLNNGNNLLTIEIIGKDGSTKKLYRDVYYASEKNKSNCKS